MGIKIIDIKNKTREITLICITTMVMVLFFSGYSIGKIFSNTQIKASGTIAEPVFIVENSSEINLTETQNEGNYIFSVKNYNETGNTAQVNMKYNIEILAPKEETISIKILKNNNEIQMENNKSEYFLLTKQEQQKDEYEIKIKYDKTKSTSIENILQDIQIKVHSEQVKI